MYKIRFLSIAVVVGRMDFSKNRDMPSKDKDILFASIVTSEITQCDVRKLFRDIRTSIIRHGYVFRSGSVQETV